MIIVNRETITGSYVKIRKNGESSKKFKKNKIVYVIEDAKMKSKEKDIKDYDDFLKLLGGISAIIVNEKIVELYFNEANYWKRTPELEIINNIGIVHALNRLLTK